MLFTRAPQMVSAEIKAPKAVGPVGEGLDGEEGVLLHLERGFVWLENQTYLSKRCSSLLHHFTIFPYTGLVSMTMTSSTHPLFELVKQCLPDVIQ